jgi:hypothetical protein
MSVALINRNRRRNLNLYILFFEAFIIQMSLTMRGFTGQLKKILFKYFFKNKKGFFNFSRSNFIILAP